MSFNHHLNFNISKATPTTSTNNTNTTSNSNAEGLNSPAVKSPPLLQNILLKSNLDPASVTSSNSTTTVTPPTTSSPKLSAGSVVPAIVTINNEESTSNIVPPTTSSNSSKTDLIGLFDKFDINKEDSKKTKSKTNEEEQDGSQYVTEKHSPDNDHEQEDEHTHSECKLEKMVSDDEEIDHHKESEIISEKETVSQANVSEPVVEQTVEKNNGTSAISAFMTIQPYYPPEDEPTSTIPNDNLIDLTDDSAPPPPEDSGEHVEYSSEKISSEKPEVPPKDIPAGTLLDITGSKNETLLAEEFNSAEVTDLDKELPELQKQQQESSAPPIQTSKHPKHRFQINDSSEQNKQSHKPFDFQNFLTHLRKKSADPIVRYIRSFLSSFTKQGHTFTAEQRIKIISDFKVFMNEKFALYEPFSAMDQLDLENSREGLEKLIMNRLHDFCFPPEVIKKNLPYIPESYTVDLKKDETFSLQLEKFSWINGSHLDIDVNDLMNTNVKPNQTFLEYAINELNKINNYRAPRDKIICILNACKIIFSYLKINSQETNADAFIPILILVIFKAKTDNLISNIHYIESFRGEEWLLHGETSYYLSSIQGAIGFIENLTAEDLTISRKEFDAHMEAWDAQKKQKKLQLKLVQPIPTNPNFDNNPNARSELLSTPTQNGLSPSSVLLSSAEMVTKSITNFLSPSPQYPESEPEEFQPPQGPPNDPLVEYQPLPPREEEIDSDKMKQAYDTLKEIFPSLDTNILKDVIFINRGNVDVCIDACLQLVDG
ncbi:hypothetical protein G210_4784 [Candida maltosa Xu316]|uniref:Uncharacterized protein n=1 Tax=Candida maltosa (strain Xu316) TaxID=1245528 RepID=M3K5X5_CANMX|nr:hypothetical protein G210_4784 [Candida maltosa Xu316]